MGVVGGCGLGPGRVSEKVGAYVGVWMFPFSLVFFPCRPATPTLDDMDADSALFG